jgi:hypothetical protein
LESHPFTAFFSAQELLRNVSTGERVVPSCCLAFPVTWKLVATFNQPELIHHLIRNVVASDAHATDLHQAIAALLPFFPASHIYGLHMLGIA